jgi:hypothetical protein
MLGCCTTVTRTFWSLTAVTGGKVISEADGHSRRLRTACADSGGSGQQGGALAAEAGLTPNSYIEVAGQAQHCLLGYGAYIDLPW